MIRQLSLSHRGGPASAKIFFAMIIDGEAVFRSPKISAEKFSNANTLREYRVQRLHLMLRIQKWLVPLSLGLLLTLSPHDSLAETPADQSQPTEAAVEEESPRVVVEILHAGLLSSMQQADELDFDSRHQRLRSLVSSTFDVEFMGSKSVGRMWQQLTPEEQQLWLDKFVAYVAANYAGNFDGHNGETFETLGDEVAQRDTRVVRTELKVPGSDDVIFNYRLRRTPQGWRIIDIYLKGTVSELALRRSDFTSTLKSKGFAELAATVDQKIADLKKESGG